MFWRNSIDLIRQQRRLPWALLACALTGAAVWACGPDFPQAPLNDRSGTLKSTPTNSFRYDIAHLLSPGDQLRANETDPNNISAQQLAAIRLQQASFGLDAALAKRMQAALQADNPAEAIKAGASLPPAYRLYNDGAVAYRAALDPQQSNPADLLRNAQNQFEAVLQLPSAQARPRAVWASYMLGRIHASQQLAAGNDAAVERTQAIHAFEQARELARQGAPDPAGLAVASYGEQARLYLTVGQLACAADALMGKAACLAQLQADDIKQAIHLYVEQAIRGSDSALNSLRLLADWALYTPGRAQGLIDDPLSQRVLVTYGVAALGDIAPGQPDTAYDICPYATPPGTTNDAARGEPDTCFGDAHGPLLRPNPVLVNLVAAIQNSAKPSMEGADQLAALAYRMGQYDYAQTLADRSHSALANWVRAKLAIRKGDMAAATQAFADAARGFPTLDASVSPRSAQLLQDQRGVLALSRGQFIEAMGFLYSAAIQPQASAGLGYDVAYVAERVLTTDELKQFVDAHAAATLVPAHYQRPEPDIDGPYAAITADDLRLLLARRLVREARLDEATAYFPLNGDPRYDHVSWDEHGKQRYQPQLFRSWLAAYRKALDQSASAWSKAGRAEGWFNAAVIARLHGMALMGYEQDPDYAGIDGSMYGVLGPLPVCGNATDPQHCSNGQAPPRTAQARALIMLPDPWASPAERSRYASSEAQPYARYHYRYIAVADALKAADLLPPRSQAYAAVLCRAAGWGTGQRQQLWTEYVRHGAAVPFAKTFGSQCPAPAFDQARSLGVRQLAQRMYARLRHHWYVPATVLVLAGIGNELLRRRRRSP